MKSPGSTSTYDAFLSYSSDDLYIVRRIQRFLESYRHRNTKQRLKVYLDRTDIRGGELTAELRDALHRSHSLIVCASPSAKTSAWVDKEIAYYRETKGDERIAIALVDGDDDFGEMPALQSTQKTYRKHDLRRGWLFNITKPRTKEELVRLLAFVSGVDLRTLRNWHLRRLVARTAVIIVIMIALIGGVSSIPQDDWTRLDLPLPARGRDSIRYANPIACEAEESNLWIAEREPGRASTTHIRIWENILDPGAPTGERRARGYFGLVKYRTNRRLLPLTEVERNWPAFLKNYNYEGTTNRDLIEEKYGFFASEPVRNKFIVIRPLKVTEEESSEAKTDAISVRFPPTRSDTDEFDIVGPVRTSAGSLVVVFDGNELPNHFVIKDMLVPWEVWKQYDSTPTDPISPLMAPSVAWDGDEKIWIGIRAQDKGTDGGLWYSSDKGRSWRREDGFRNVSSILIRGTSHKHESIVVAESHAKLWQDSSIKSYRASVREKHYSDDNWNLAHMPPYGDSSEIELCGTLKGDDIVRVDGSIFRFVRVPLWRYRFAK